MFTGLRSRLILLVLLAILPVLGLALYSGQEQRRQAAIHAQTETMRLARLAASNQQALIEGGQQLLVALARLPLLDTGDLAACDAFLAGLLHQYSYYINLGVAAPNGDLLCSALPHPDPVSYGDRAWLQETVKTADFVVGEYVIGRISGAALLPLAYPSLDESGRVRYVVFSAVDLAWLSRLPDDVQLPQGSVLTVIDRNGTILARNPDQEQWVGKVLPEAAAIEAILGEGHEGTAELTGLDGVQRLHSISLLGSQGGVSRQYVSIGIPTSIVYAEANRLLAINLAGLGLVTLLAMGLAQTYSHVFIMSKVNALLRATQRLARGDLKTRTDGKYGHSELSQLAKAFDEMAGALERRETERKQAEERYFRLFETMINGFALHEIITGEDGRPCDYRFLEVNPAFEKITGLQADAVVGRNVRAIIPDIDRYWIDTYGAVALTGSTVQFEHYDQVLGKHFEVFAYSPQKGQFATLFLDATGRKQAQDELLRANRALRTISECNLVLVRAKDETGLLSEICQTLVSVGGYRMAWVAFAEQDQARTLRPVAQAGFEDVRLQELGTTWGPGEDDRGPTGAAIRSGAVCKSGSLPSASVREPWPLGSPESDGPAAIALPLLHEGKAFGALTLYSREPGAFAEQEERLLQELADDLAYGILALRTRTAHRQAEQALLESAERYRSTLDNMLEGCQIIGFDWRYIYLNDAAAGHGRRAKHELIGRPMMEIYPGIEQTSLFAALQRCMLERTSNLMENEFTFPDGSSGWFELGIRPVPEGIFILSVDISERKRAEKVQASLYRISQAAVLTSSIDELYSSIHQILGELMPVQNFYIALYDPASDLLSFPYFVDQYDPPGPPQKAGRGLTEYVLRTGKPLLASPEVFHRLVQQGEVELVGTDSVDWLGVPLKSEERVIGAIVAQSYTEGVRYSQDDLDLLEFVSTQVALAIERKQSELRIQHLSRLYATLSQVNQTIVRVKEPGELFSTISKLTVDYGRFGAAWIGLVDHASGLVNPVALHGAAPEQFPRQPINIQRPPFSQGLMGLAVQSGKPAYSQDIQSDPRMQHWYETMLVNGYHSAVAVPFFLNGEVYGLLNLYAAEADFFADEELQSLIEEMAKDISFALDTIELEARRKLAEDSLRVSEFRFYSAFEYAPIGMALVAPDGRWLRVNRALCEIVGYSSDEMLTKTFQNITHPDDLETDLDYVQQMLAGKIQSYQMEKRYFHKTGRIIWALLSVSLVHDSAARPMYFVSQIQDITNSKRAEDQIRQNAWRAEALAHTAALLNAQLNLERVLETVCEQVAHFLNAPVVTVYLADEPAKMLAPARAVGMSPEAARRLSSIPLVEYKKLAGEANEPLVIADVQAISGLPDAALFAELGFRSHINIGLRHAGQIIGFLNVLTVSEARHWSEADIALLKGLADQSAQALVNARLFDQATTRLSRVQALRKIDVAITNNLEPQVSIDVILEQITAQTGVDAACVLLFNSQTQTLNFAAGHGFTTEALQYTHLRMGEGYAGQAALGRRVINIPDLKNRKTDFLRSLAFAAERFVAYYAIPLIAKDQVKGVLEIFHRSPLEPDQEWLDFLETLAGQAAIALDNAGLYAGMQRSNLDLTLAYDATIEGWSRALDLRDKETEGHTQRVTEMTEKLARVVGIGEAELVHIRRGALLHDIGKMGIPDNILLKNGPLSEDEWELMRKHPVYAYDMLAPIAYLQPALDIPYCHHEKWDGTGYPRRLKGESIPLAARIFAVADVWDALTSDRPYRKAWSREKAIRYIQQQAGSHFDPEIVKVFINSPSFWRGQGDVDP